MAPLPAGIPTEPPPYPRFSTLAELVFTTGSSSEILYPSSASSQLMSRLVWAIPPSVGLAETLNVLWDPWFETDLQFEGFVPLAEGTMTDDDWNIRTGSGSLWSRVHSDSQSRMQANWWGSLEVGLPLHWGVWGAKFLLGVGVRQLAWQSWNTAQVSTEAGTGQQSSVAVNGIATTFRQTWVLPVVGFVASWSPSPWGVAVTIRASPYLFETQTDVHILRSTTFVDDLKGGFSVELKTELSYRLANNFVVEAHAGFRRVSGLRGDELVSGGGGISEAPVLYAWSAGTGMVLFTLGVGFRIGTF